MILDANYFRMDYIGYQLSQILNNLPNDEKLIIDRTILETIVKYVKNRFIVHTNDNTPFEMELNSKQENLLYLEKLEKDVREAIDILKEV